MNQIPYWVKLIRHFDIKGYFINGPTIPFLIGARKHIEPKSELLSIKDLFDEINRFSTPVTVMWCNDIKEYVWGILLAETNMYRLQYPEMYRELGNVVVTDNSFGTLGGNALVDEMEGLYNDKIKNGYYSKNNGIWGDFFPKEVERLKEIK